MSREVLDSNINCQKATEMEEPVFRQRTEVAAVPEAAADLNRNI